ncbi:MAG: SOS response-associated peptidase [Planctomycetota bacterium]|jgi:putative SOS response-associated peptidase YedK|nr:SOS response-associated peptidase [Planctomycetota bacterium]
MCGRFALATIPKPLFAAFGLPLPDLPPRYNIAPGQSILSILRPPEGGSPVASVLDWGFLPAWSQRRQPLINARVETVNSLASFRGAFRHRRCLIPASGFYEWKREGRSKRPFYFTPADQETVLVLAGLWEDWNDGQEYRRTGVILTTPANADMASVHSRMPLIMEEANWEEWLGQEGAGVPSRLLRPAAEGFLSGREVSSRVNRVENEGADCLASPEGNALPTGDPGDGEKRGQGGQATLF